MPKQKLPSDPLHRELALMGFDEDKRQAPIDASRGHTIAGIPTDPIRLGSWIAGMQADDMLTKLAIRQPWYVRFRFWLLRKWRRATNLKYLKVGEEK